MIMVFDTHFKGRGIKAITFICKDSIVETAHLIVLNKEDTPLIERTLLDNYVFEYDEERVCIALGTGSLYNHNSTPNIECHLDAETNTMNYVALRDIHSGEELEINYGWEVETNGKNNVRSGKVANRDERTTRSSARGSVVSNFLLPDGASSRTKRGLR